jgi:hypothetical protein
MTERQFPALFSKPDIQISLNNSFNQTVNAPSITISPEEAKRLPIKERKSHERIRILRGRV